MEEISNDSTLHTMDINEKPTLLTNAGTLIDKLKPANHVSNITSNPKEDAQQDLNATLGKANWKMEVRSSGKFFLFDTMFSCYTRLKKINYLSAKNFIYFYFYRLNAISLYTHNKYRAICLSRY